MMKRNEMKRKEFWKKTGKARKRRKRGRRKKRREWRTSEEGKESRERNEELRKEAKCEDRTRGKKEKNE